MTPVNDGAFDLDAALVLVRVDPRRGCAELHRLLAGEVAAYARALGAEDVGTIVDDVLDRALRDAIAFAGHGREFRIEALRVTTDAVAGQVGTAADSELGAAVLVGVLGCAIDEAADVVRRSLAFVRTSIPSARTVRHHRRRFPTDDAPPPGPALARHLGPRERHLPPRKSDATFADRGPRRRSLLALALIALLGLGGAATTLGVATQGGTDTESTSVKAAGADVIVANSQPTPSAQVTEPLGPPDTSDPATAPAQPQASSPPSTAWSYDVRDCGQILGTIDATGTLHASVEPSPGWAVQVDEDTPPWYQATFSNGVDQVRFLAVADDGAVRVWVFDLGPQHTDTEVAAPPVTPRPTSRPPAPAPMPDPTPRESPPPRPAPTPPLGGGDIADPTPTPPEAQPTPDQPDASPTPDEPDPTATPDDPDEPDPSPTPDEPDDPDEEGSGNSGPGGGDGDRDPDGDSSGPGSGGD